jgi:hypothetical protein
MNPIKSPQEMLLEQAGIPHLAGGKAVSKFASKGAELLFNDFVKKATRVKGAPLTAEEMALVEKHVGTLSQPTSPILRSGMSAEPRAFHELRTDPNLIAPDDVRDPLVVKSFTGRAKSGTKLNPKTEDVHGTQEVFEQEARLNQLPQEEAKVQRAAAGEYPSLADEGMHPGAETRDIPVSESTWAPSTTPSADAFARMSEAARAEALAKNFGRTNKSLYEVLINNFVKEHGRQPDYDELNALIAAYNPERHQLSEIGNAIVSERPTSQKGMSDWKEKARLSGIKETYVGAHPSDYSKELKHELELSRGIVPEVKDKKEYKLRPSRPDLKPVETYMEGDVPVNVYPAVKKEGGHITPDQMRHMMVAYGKEPKKFKGGGDTTDWNQMMWEHTKSHPDYYDLAPKWQAYEPSAEEKVADLFGKGLQSIGMTPRQSTEQGQKLYDYGTFAIDPLAIPRILDEVKHGQYLPAAVDAAVAGPGTYGAYKTAQAIAKRLPGAAAVPAAIGTVGSALSKAAANQLRNQPTHQKQMQSMSDDPYGLGGALSGDAGIAAQILANAKK